MVVLVWVGHRLRHRFEGREVDHTGDTRLFAQHARHGRCITEVHHMVPNAATRDGLYPVENGGIGIDDHPVGGEPFTGGEDHTRHAAAGPG